MMSLTFGLFTQVSGSGPLGPLVIDFYFCLSRYFDELEDLHASRKLCKTRRKMRVKLGMSLNRLSPLPYPSNYYWPSQGGTFVADSFV